MIILKLNVAEPQAKFLFFFKKEGGLRRKEVEDGMTASRRVTMSTGHRRTASLRSILCYFMFKNYPVNHFEMQTRLRWVGSVRESTIIFYKLKIH